MKRHLAAAVLIVSAVLLAYSNSLLNGFTWDDHLYVEANPLLAHPSNLALLLDWRYYAGTQGVLAGSRPVFLASLLADRALWGFSPWGYHLTNALLHAADALWVYALAWTAVPVWPAALLAGMIFALHPATTEAVNAVSFRSDLLSAFFVFASLWVYLKLKARPGSKRRLAALAAACAGLFGLGLLSKEMAASLPLLFLLVEAYFPSPKGRLRRVGAVLAACAVVAAAFAVFWTPRFRYLGMGPRSAARAVLDRAAAEVATAPPAGTPALKTGAVFASAGSEWSEALRRPATRFWTAGGSLAGAFGLLAFPATLVADRAPRVLRSGLEARALGSLLLLGLLLAYAVLMRRRHPPSAFAVAWCFAAWLPVSGVFPLANPVADRYLYLLCAGAAWFAASALAAFGAAADRRAMAAGVAVALLLAFGARTYARNLDWESDRALFLTAPRTAPQSSRAAFIRGGLLQAEGRPLAAAGEYKAALSLNPRFAEAWLGLGEAYGALRQPAPARLCFDKAVALAPDNAVLRFSYASFLAGHGLPKEAVAMYRSCLELQPRFVQAWVNLASLYGDFGKAREAAAGYEKALALAPDDPFPYFSYGLFREKYGQKSRAAALYRAALAKDPAFEGARVHLARLRR